MCFLNKGLFTYQTICYRWCVVFGKGGGGDTWASTYLDVLRTLNELGGFSKETRGVIFHNTLAASDYAFLERIVFNPRPNYFAVLLWNRLMGTTVYDTKEEVREGAHVYAQSRKDGKDGNKRATVMTLNGRDLVLGENNELPDLSGDAVAAGTIELAPMTCTFLVI